MFSRKDIINSSGKRGLKKDENDGTHNMVGFSGPVSWGIIFLTTIVD